MPRPFHPLTLPEFSLLLEEYPFTRRITEVHMHHTWRPTHAQDRGRASVEAMWRYHTQHLGWSDIAQHLTIDTHGTLWTGRDWNAPPASAAGFNGNAAVGPFMFEMIGDFDVGRDPFEDPQRHAALMVVALVQRRFGLAPEALRFHNQMSPKSCPGTALHYDATVEAVRALHAQLDAAEQEDEPTPEELLDELGLGLRAEPFGPEDLAVTDILADLAGALRPVPDARNAPRDPADAELPEHYTTDEIILLTGGAPAYAPAPEGLLATEERGGGGRLTDAMLQELDDHVVNLTHGQFSTSGRHTTTPADVARLFERRLPAALQTARDLGEPLHVVFYAHGGLVDEDSGLARAHQHVTWWSHTANVYPVYFVWETGLLRQLVQIASGAPLDRAARDLTDATDWLIERVLGLGGLGPRVWSGMKQDAQMASMPPGGPLPAGGAHVVAEALADFVTRYRQAFQAREIRLHAVGHSAGAVFHSFFVPVALAAGAKRFDSLHFLAPALTVADFRQRLQPVLGQTVDHLTLYTMTDRAERRDTCLGLYRKSLLYLIRHALEDENPTPILGLLRSLKNDDAMVELFGLGGGLSDLAEVVPAPTPATAPPDSASEAVTHGGFDEDPATLHSLHHRIVGRAPAVAFPQPSNRGRAALAPEPETLDAEALAVVFGPPPRPTSPPSELPPSALPAPKPPSSAFSADAHAAPGGVQHREGRRLALCVGIDAYPQDRLGGCVHDARAWADTLRARGFETTLLTDGAATYEGLVAALQALVAAGAPGDVLVFQFSGHGTFFPDRDGDEAIGGSGLGEDQAFCPVDFRQGPTLLDDEVRELYAQLAPGVNLTSFLDCCHSGTITRLAFAGDSRPRTVAPNDRMRAFRAERRRALTGSRAVRSAAAMRDVAFAAAQPDELAFETNGQGDFTRRALRVLRQRARLTNEGFHAAVVDAFGPSRRQTPYLDAPAWAHDRPLLAPYPVQADEDNEAPEGPPDAASPFADPALVQSVLDLNRKLDAMLKRL